MKKGLKLFATGFIAMSALAWNVNADDITKETELEACLSKESATCIVTKDFEITKSHIITTGKDITFDLNGKKVIAPDAKNNWYAFIVDGGKLTLKDTSVDKTGELWAKCYGIETKSGTFVMENGKITATNNPSLGAAIVNYGGKAEIKGGTLVAASNWAVNVQSYFSNAELIISGGSFEVTSEENSTIQVGGQYTSAGHTTDYKETVTIIGGTFKGKNSFAVSEDANATVSIKGGSFTTDVTNYVADGYKVSEDAEGNYNVEPIVYEVTKGENQKITVEKGTEITITIDADYEKFDKLYINDELLVKDEDYTVKSGSTIITLKPEYVETLGKGDYEIKATFNDGGIVTTGLTLVENKVIEAEKEISKTEVKNPKTSDGVMKYFIVSIISVLGLMLSSLFVVRKQN